MSLELEITRDDGFGDENPRLVADGTRWRVEVDGLEGFGGVSYDVSTRDYAQYDGSLLLAERTPEQDRTIVLVARFDVEEARDEAMAFFIPRREYTVRCTLDGRTRHFVGRQYAMKVDLGSVNLPTRVTWTCLSTMPYWLSEDEHSFDIAEAAGRRGFPFASNVDSSTTDPVHVQGYVVGELSHVTSLTNGGHVPTYPRFVVTCSGGTVTNPRVVVNDRTGSAVLSVTVDTTMADGDVLVLDFDSRPTTVELNGANVSNLVEPGSTLAASIGVGDYTVEWSADSGDAAMSVVPYIRERYTGI
jgi:hypothetical protein